MSTAQVNFSGQVLTLIVPFRNGGGTDRWARFWAPLIADKLPGKPEIRIKNVVGGGSTKGANEFYETSGEDGMMLFASSASVMYPYLLGDRRVNYDFNDWLPLLASPTGGIVFASPEVVNENEQPYRLRGDDEMRILLQGPTQVGVLMMLSLELLGHNYVANFGAGGASTTFRNFREGHANVDMQTTSSYKINVNRLVRDGSALPIFTFGIRDYNGRIVRDPNFPDIPHFLEYYELVKGEQPSGVVSEAWRSLFLAGFPAQKILIIPKNTDPKVIETFERAVKDAVDDVEIWPETHQDVLGDYRQYRGEEAQEVLAQTAGMDNKDEVAQWFRQFIKDKSGITL